MFEKPAPGTTESDMAIIGRYILQPEIFSLLEETEPGYGGEIQLTDALLKLSRQRGDRKSTRLNSSHRCTTYAVFCLKKKTKTKKKKKQTKDVSSNVAA